VPALAPNAVHTITRYQHIAQPGHFRVAFIADASGAVAESNENNNEKFTDFSVKEHNEHNNAIKVSITVGP
jgi:hypothetical protein